jgi:N-methylhydantoinase A
MPLPAQDSRQRIKSHRKVYSGREGSREMPVYDGTVLGAGAQFDGPALIEQPTTTILILAGQKATVDTCGNILIDTMPGSVS